MALAGCPRCTGPMYRSHQGEYCCLFCGEYMFTQASQRPGAERPILVPPAPGKRGRPRKPFHTIQGAGWGASGEATGDSG
jgi:uncharacterized Zn finger protein (UPF0148 family)